MLDNQGAYEKTHKQLGDIFWQSDSKFPNKQTLNMLSLLSVLSVTKLKHMVKRGF